LRIIHTSDIHLSFKKKQCLDALEGILDTAGKKKADLVIIGGDMFDSSQEADTLRPKLRKLMSSLPFSILVIPGNHDMEAYSSDMNFGDSVQVANKHPFEVLDFKDVRIAAVPYANQAFNELTVPLKESIDEGKLNILVIHCSLDISHLGEDEYGDEKRQAYLPVNSKVLGDIGFDYVFAGHFHTRAVESRLSEKTLFFYPGSPASVTRKEKGRRSVVFLDTKKKPAERISLLDLDSFYYDDVRVEFMPKKEEEALKELEKILREYRGQKVEIDLTVGGFIASGEKDISERIKKIVKAAAAGDVAVNTAEEYRDISSVLEDPLYAAFKKNLDDSGLDEELKRDMDEMVILKFSGNV